MVKFLKALKFAETAHLGQKRKYSDRPYVFHCIEVFLKLLEHKIFEEDILIASMEHDTIEDTNVTFELLENEFGKNVANLVLELTQPDKLDLDIKKLPRIERHKLLLNKLKNVSGNAKIIKLADRLCNLKDSNPLENNECYGFFKKRYLQESKDIYEVLKNAHEGLANELYNVIQDLAVKCKVELK